MTIADMPIEQVQQIYAAGGGQVGAICTLVSAMPLADMLAANERIQAVSVLMAPQGADPQALAAHRAALVNDHKVLEALLSMQRTYQAVVGINGARVVVSSARPMG